MRRTKNGSRTPTGAGAPSRQMATGLREIQTGLARIAKAAAIMKGWRPIVRAAATRRMRPRRTGRRPSTTTPQRQAA